jgi:hypothetical protein
MRGAGKDCTELFCKFNIMQIYNTTANQFLDKTHAWVSVDSLLKECCIGILKR